MQKISNILTYKEALSYLESFSNYENVRNYTYSEKYFDLKRVLNLSAFFDNPHKRFRSVHIAGTKGKGSTAKICAYILASCGYTVGLYTSPHLTSFRERIKIIKKENRRKILERMISQKDVINLTQNIKYAVDKLFCNTSSLPTTFELYTILAFLYFAKKKIDVGVIEVGLGGRLDATNIIYGDVCIITTIGYDHTSELGSTLAKIATEKAGIIKEHRKVISSPQRKAAEKIIKKICMEKYCKLYTVGKEIKIRILSKNEPKRFDVQGIFKKYKNLKLSLLGEHQIINAATAIGAVELFQNRRISQDLRDILKKVHIPGRIQIIGKNPTIILDGAHNPESAEVLVKTISELNYKRAIFIVSIFSDKQIKLFLKTIMKIAQKIILTKIPYPRCADPEDILKLFPYNSIFEIKPEIKKAIMYAKSIAKKNDLICITGSLYLVGEVLKTYYYGTS